MEWEGDLDNVMEVAEAMEKADVEFRNYLLEIGFEVVPAINGLTNICSALTQALELEDPTSICFEIANYLMDHADDEEIIKIGGITSREQMVSQVNTFLEENGSHGDDKLACLVVSRIHQLNISVYEEIGVSKEYPGVLQEQTYGRTISLSLHNGVDFHLLRPLLVREIAISRHETEYQRDEKFRDFLKEQGFQICRVLGDGNCFFSAIARATKIDDPFTVRRQIAKYIGQHIEDEEITLHFTGFTKEARDDKIKRIKEKQSEWADELSIIAASRLYNININVYMAPEVKISYSVENDLEGETVDISYHLQNHYNLLKRSTPQVATTFNNEAEPSVCSNADEQDWSDDNLPEGVSPPGSGDENVETSEIRVLLDDLELESKEYVYSSVFKTGRSQIHAYILVYGQSEAKSIQEALMRSQTKTLFLLIDYNKQFGKELLGDEELRKEFTVWRCTLGLPWNGAPKERYVWLSHLMVLPLILTTARITWRDYSVKALFLSSKTAMMTTLLNNIWNLVKDAASTDIELIMEDNSRMFCFQCSENCAMKSRAWHHDLSKFKRIDFTDPTGCKFLDKFLFFDSREEPATVEINFLNQLKEVYWEGNRNVDGVIEMLDDNLNSNAQTNWYCSYLILILDGRRMKDYKDLDIYEILGKRDIYKLVYGGSTTNSYFRKSHLKSPQSAIFPYLTETSRIIFIRKKIYKSFLSVKRDEAMVIEILKTNTEAYHQKKKNPPYFFLNVRSELSKLLRGNKEMLENIQLFSDIAIPIFSKNASPETRYEGFAFKGNYLLEEEVQLENGVYKDRRFKDVKHLYEDLKYNRRK